MPSEKSRSHSPAARSPSPLPATNTPSEHRSSTPPDQESHLHSHPPPPPTSRCMRPFHTPPSAQTFRRHCPITLQRLLPSTYLPKDNCSSPPANPESHPRSHPPPPRIPPSRFRSLSFSASRIFHRPYSTTRR